MQSSRALVAGFVLLALPLAAFANAIWPPAVYFYTLTIWWIIPLGLGVEFVVHLIILRMSVISMAKITIISNVASTLLGFLLLWPVVFWDRGVQQLAALGPASIFGVLVAILVVNTVIEYLVSVVWLTAGRSVRTAVSFIVANLLSYALVFVLAMSGLLSDS